MPVCCMLPFRTARILLVCNQQQEILDWCAVSCTMEGSGDVARPQAQLSSEQGNATQQTVPCHGGGPQYICQFRHSSAPSCQVMQLT